MASTDNMFVMIGFFVTGLIILIFAVIWSSMADVSFLWSQADVGASIKSNTQGFVDSWDFIMVCLYFGTHLSILALSFLLRSHPVIYVSAIGITVLLVLIAAPLSNSFDDLISNPAFVDVQGDFTMTHYIMNKLPFFELVWSILTMIMLFGFARYEGIV